MNPWSRDITEATVVFASASGRVYPSQVLNVGVETVRSDGRDVRARHYRVTANRKTYDLWYDEAGRLARFTAPEKGGAVTFILTDVRCRLTARRDGGPVREGIAVPVEGMRPRPTRAHPAPHSPVQQGPHDP